jgi:hypothetical protein
METLYEKLTKENRTKLRNYKEKYPTISGKLIVSLKAEVAWTELKVIEMMQLFEALEVKEFNFINPLDNLFYGK